MEVLSLAKFRSTNRVVETHLDEHLEELEEDLESDVLVFSSPLTYTIDDVVRDALEHRKAYKNKPSRDKITVMLETVGGYITVAERIADTLRYHYDRVEFIVPNYAMSAGTVLAMSGDAIHMDYYSILGPIDPQVQKKNHESMIPAMGYVEEYDRLMAKADAGTLNELEASIVIEKLDLAELNSYKHARDLSIELLKQWLVKYKFKNWTTTRTRGLEVTPAMKEQRAHEIADQLGQTSKWHTHGRGINMAVLESDLNLVIEDFGKNAGLNEKIRAYSQLLQSYTLDRRTSKTVHTLGRFNGW